MVETEPIPQQVQEKIAQLQSADLVVGVLADFDPTVHTEKTCPFLHVSLYFTRTSVAGVSCARDDVLGSGLGCEQGGHDKRT